MTISNYKTKEIEEGELVIKKNLEKGALVPNFEGYFVPKNGKPILIIKRRYSKFYFGELLNRTIQYGYIYR